MQYVLTYTRNGIVLDVTVRGTMEAVAVRLDLEAAGNVVSSQPPLPPTSDFRAFFAPLKGRTDHG